MGLSTNKNLTTAKYYLNTKFMSTKFSLTHFLKELYFK